MSTDWENGKAKRESFVFRHNNSASAASRNSKCVPHHQDLTPETHHRVYLPSGWSGSRADWAPRSKEPPPCRLSCAEAPSAGRQRGCPPQPPSRERSSIRCLCWAEPRRAVSRRRWAEGLTSCCQSTWFVSKRPAALSVCFAIYRLTAVQKHEFSVQPDLTKSSIQSVRFFPMAEDRGFLFQQ